MCKIMAVCVYEYDLWREWTLTRKGHTRIVISLKCETSAQQNSRRTVEKAKGNGNVLQNVWSLHITVTAVCVCMNIIGLHCITMNM